MSDRDQFGEMQPAKLTGTVDCSVIDLWLTDAVEGSLPASWAGQVREHAAVCSACQQKLTQARRGHEWLLVLKQEVLEPPAGLVEKILARTSSAARLAAWPSRDTDPVVGLPKENPASRITVGYPKTNLGRTMAEAASAPRSDLGQVFHVRAAELSDAGPDVQPWQRTPLVVLRRRLFEPRLALVAAMAFFSISLTLNLVGIRITRMRAADLAPQNLRRTVTRQYAEANAHVVRYYENLRIVYEVESRVQQLRRAAEAAPQPEPADGKRRNGSSDTSRAPQRVHGSSREHMAGNATGAPKQQAAPPDPVPVIAGPQMDVSLPLLQGVFRWNLSEVQLRGRLARVTPAGLHISARFSRELSTPPAFLCLVHNENEMKRERGLA